jgi:polysaccharide export outer membrane protein
MSGALSDSAKQAKSAHWWTRKRRVPGENDHSVKQRVIGLCCGVVWLLGGCASNTASVPPPLKEPRAPLPSAEYRIGPEDILEIVVWKNADLSRTVTVRPDGMITLPLIGELRAGGLAADEVRNEIKTRLERYKEMPEVTVTVSDVRSYNVYVLGEVKAPGRYQVKSYTTVLQLLALAGGFTEWAHPSQLVVVRRDGGTADKRIRLRYDDLIARGDMGLMPGDTLIVQ